MVTPSPKVGAKKGPNCRRPGRLCGTIVTVTAQLGTVGGDRVGQGTSQPQFGIAQSSITQGSLAG
ncbi:MAG: hypothetical protein U0175_35700 [Caldilineaceae bacterium]